MIELFRSENVLVRSVPAEDVSRWVVTFDNYGIGRGFDRLAFGEAFFCKSAVSAIHVMGAREDWYQYPEMAQVMAVVRRATAGAARVMTYGSSMGGYAALRFADAAGANAVLAISPQYSLDPAKAPFETRWRQEASRIQWLPDIDGPLACSCTPVIVFDPASDDNRHVNMIATETAIERIALRHSGHPSATYLAELELLGPLALQTLSGELDVEAFRSDARRQRRQCPAYLSRLADLQPASRVGLALTLARMANAVAPANPIALLALASILSRTGDHEQAIALHEEISRVTGRAPNYLVPHAQALVDAGRLGEARILSQEVVGANPGAANLWAWLGYIEWQCGAIQPAIAAVERAIDLHPEHAEYRMLMDRVSSSADHQTAIKGRRPRALRIAKRWLSRLTLNQSMDRDPAGSAI